MKINLTFDELMKAALLSGDASTSTVAPMTEPPSLTLESIMDLKRQLEHPIYYLASPYAEKGKHYRLPETELNPEYWLIHTDDELSFCDIVRRADRIARYIRSWNPKIMSRSSEELDDQ